MTTRIHWKSCPIGACTPHGKTLDKAAFLALPKVERLRAYLLLVWPAARASHVLARVCQVRCQDVKNFLKCDVRDGVVVRPARGQWQAVPHEVCP